MSIRPLARASYPEWSPAPPRMVHVGLGAFHRAHQADFTDRAREAANWGITAFTGSSSDLPRRLATQDGLYTLTTKGADGDTCRVVTSLVAAHAGGDTDAWRTVWASPETQIVTLTVTEDAYAAGPRSVAPRLADALDARRRAGAGPITIIPCDNVPDNAHVLRALVMDAASRIDPGLVEWVDATVGFVGSVVDRITPTATHLDTSIAADFGWRDAAPVVTEPFAEWVLGRGFVTEHPDWASAGARFVDDLTPFSRRKLYLLNGAHTLLGHLGLLRGHATVAQAIGDHTIAEWIMSWWTEAVHAVGQDTETVTGYTDALITRFTNPRLEHRLVQIATDASRKLAVRVAPVAHFEWDAGRPAPISAVQFGAWVAWVRVSGERLSDARAHEIRRAAHGSLDDATRRLVALVDRELADDDAWCAAVSGRAAQFGEARER